MVYGLAFGSAYGLASGSVYGSVFVMACGFQERQKQHSNNLFLIQ